jgi:hypothetical protein
MVGFFEQHLAGAPASDWRLGDAGLVRVRDAATGLRAAR